MMSKNIKYLIAELEDTAFDPSFVPPKNLDDYKIRRAARGILLNDTKMAVLFVSSANYHKLPGGGIESDETKEIAFTREVKEETGCDCKILDTIPQGSVVLETRDKFKLFQISYIFFCKLVGKPGKPHLMPDEIAEGHDLKWIPVSEVVGLLEKDKPTTYEGKFIRARDLAVLNFYKKLLV